MSSPTAVVTGASRGIGAAVARELLRRGWTVWVPGRDARALAGLADGPGVAAGTLIPVELDLADDGELTSWSTSFNDGRQPLNALVHCAGVVLRGSAQDTGVAGLDRQLAVNLRAPYLLTTALLPALERGQGVVVLVNSTQGLRAGADAVGYAASKHALKGFADGLREEVNPRGVRVTSIYPGRTDTPGQAEVFRYENRPYQPEGLLTADTVAGLIVMTVTLPGSAEITDLTVRPSRKLQ